MKPTISRALRPGMEKLLEYGSCLGITFGWICQTHSSDSKGWERFNERNRTWSDTPSEAWRKWFVLTRQRATCLITNREVLPPLRMKHCSSLARVTLGLIEHDRYLLKVDSRQPGGKGNM